MCIEWFATLKQYCKVILDEKCDDPQQIIMTPIKIKVEYCASSMHDVQNMFGLQTWPSCKSVVHNYDQHQNLQHIYITH